MKRKLLSLIALVAGGGVLGAWGYAQDGSTRPVYQPTASANIYSEPGRFQPPASGNLTGQLQAVNQAVLAEHGSNSPADETIQQTGGLDWLLERRPQSGAQQPEATPSPQAAAVPAASPEAGQSSPAATARHRGPAPVTVDLNAAKAYRGSSTPASTANGTTTTQFKPVQSRLLAPSTQPASAEEPRVAARPLAKSQPAAEQATAEPQLAAPQPLLNTPAARIDAPSFSDQSLPAGTAAAGDALLAAVSPQLAATVNGPNSLVLGRETKYVVRMQNGGGAAARNVVVNIKLPAWVNLLSTEAQSGVARGPEQGEEALVWTISDLPPGSIAELELQLAATEPRPVALDITYASAPIMAAATIEVKQPKLAVTLNGPNEIAFGEVRNYSLAVSNPGNGDAENVVLQLQPLSRNLEAGVTKDLGTLRAGERRTIEIELTAEEAGQLAVRAAVSARGGLQAETQLTVHVRRAALAIEVIGPPQKFAGAEAVYQVKVSNSGDAPANGVALAAILPEGAEVLDATEGAAEEAGSLGWSVGSLAPGDARIYRVVCALGKAGMNTFETRVKSESGLSASHAVRTMVEAIADLKLLVNDPKGPVAVGREAYYEIRIINRGSKAAENVQVKGYFSEGIEPESIDGALGKIEVGQAVFDTIARVEAGEEVVLKIKSRATAGGNHIFRAVVECEKPETRLVSEETTRYFETTAAEFGDTLKR